MLSRGKYPQGARLARINHETKRRDSEQKFLNLYNRGHTEEKIISTICKQRPSIDMLNRVEFSIILVKYFTRGKEDSKSSGKNVIVPFALKRETIKR